MSTLGSSPKLETSLTDNVRVLIYDCHMFILQARDVTERMLYFRFVVVFYGKSWVKSNAIEGRTEIEYDQ
jgi:hypothetical protein